MIVPPVNIKHLQVNQYAPLVQKGRHHQVLEELLRVMFAVQELMLMSLDSAAVKLADLVHIEQLVHQRLSASKFIRVTRRHHYEFRVTRPVDQGHSASKLRSLGEYIMVS